MIKCRDSNSLKELSDNRLRKTSAVSLKGEIHWYSHVPDQVRDLFPKMHAYDRECFRWYVMDNEVESFSATDLLVRNRLNCRVLTYILRQLDRIHKCVSSDDIDIYANYVPKLRKRYTEYDYSTFPDSENIFNYLCTALERYGDLHLG